MFLSFIDIVCNQFLILIVLIMRSEYKYLGSLNEKKLI